MKKVVLKFTIVFSIFSATYCQAGTWHNSTIKTVYPLGNGNFILRLEDDNQQCTNSNSPQYYYVEIGKHSINAEGANKIYSAALTAAASGKSVDIYFDETAPKCYINRIRVRF